MGKRAADQQLTKDDYEQNQQSSQYSENNMKTQEANPDTLKTRVFVKAKRTTTNMNSTSTSTPSILASNHSNEIDKNDKNVFPKFHFCTENINTNHTENNKQIHEKTSEDITNTTSSTSTFSFNATTPAKIFSFGDTPFGMKSTTESVGFGGTTTGILTFGKIASGAGQSDFAENGTQLEHAEEETGLSTDCKPKEEFIGKTKEASGEEDDEIVLKHRARVYVMKLVEKNTKEKSGDDGGNEATDEENKTESETSKEGTASEKINSWVPIGVGELHINRFKDNGKSKGRLILRADKTQRLVLNAPIFKQIKFELQGDKFVRFLSLDLDATFRSFLLKFSTKDEASAVMHALETVVNSVD